MTLGAGLFLFFHVYLILIAILLLLLEGKKFLQPLIICGAFYLYSLILSPPHSLPENQTTGTAYFKISSIKRHAGPFSHSLVYEGIIKKFIPDGSSKTYHDLPCRAYLKSSSNRPEGNRDYRIENATLLTSTPYHYILKSNSSLWKGTGKRLRLAEWRYKMHKKVRSYLFKKIKKKPAATFLSGLATGNLEHRLMKYEFGRVGLQHLLAISGFHFALIAGFSALLLRLFLSYRNVAFLQLILLSAYFLYLGSSPSIGRAWIAIFLFLFGYLFGYLASPLNTLGVALMIALLCEPVILTHIGFQLSFMATLGILFFYKPFEMALRKLLPKRTTQEALALHPFSQCGYLLTTFIRKLFALNLSVQLFTIPLLLYHFQDFSLLGLIYNLYFPLLLSVTLLLLLLSVILPFLHPINALYSAFLLEMISAAPKAYEFHLKLSIPLGLLYVILISLFLIALKKQRVSVAF